MGLGMLNRKKHCMHGGDRNVSDVKFAHTTRERVCACFTSSTSPANQRKVFISVYHTICVTSSEYGYALRGDVT